VSLTASGRIPNLISIIACLAIAGVAALGLRLTMRSRPADRMADFPPKVLWAWERPENLLFLNPTETGVAFLARTLYFRDGGVVVRPRFQPLRVPSGTKLIAVVHAESDWPRSSLPPEQRLKAAEAIVELQRLPNLSAVQIDFDARQSERRFYQQLLSDVRARLDPKLKLSMTALASWCLYDDWLEHLPVDEVVPMLFRMGVDHQRVSEYLARHKRFRSGRCQTSLGVSLDEPLRALRINQRVYLFNPKTWSETAFKTAVAEIFR
jgi:hypothetical protein